MRAPAAHVYLVPDEATAAAVRRAIPGALCSLAPGMAGDMVQDLRRLARALRPLYLGWLPDGPMATYPAPGEIVRCGQGWIVRGTDYGRADLREVAGTAQRRVVVFRRRGAGLGDVISILGVVQKWKRDHREHELHLDSIAPIASIAAHHPDLTGIHTDPATVPDGLVLSLGMPDPPRLERCRERRRTLNRQEMFAAMAGVSGPESPRIYLTDPEREEALTWLLRKRMVPGEFLALVWRCRDQYKDYAHVIRLYHRLRLSHDVLIIENQLSVPGPATHALSIRQQAALISWARLVITPDTGWLHVAGGLRRPIFGLYGSHNGALRQGGYPVPGGWMQGPCHRGQQPCIEETCLGRHSLQPCLQYSAASAEARILETLAALPK